MSNQKSKDVDPLTSMELGNIRIVKAWMGHYGITLDKEHVKRLKAESGQAIIEVQVDDDMNETIKRGNPDWKPGRTGTVKIVFQFED